MTRSLPTRRAFVALSALSVATVFAPAVVRAGGANAATLGSVTIAVGGQGVLYHLPLVLADQLGFFREEGLDVVVSDFPAGALAVQAVQSGAADVCVGAFEHTLRQQVSWRLDSTRLKSEYPEVYAAFAKQTRSLVLNLKLA